MTCGCSIDDVLLWLFLDRSGVDEREYYLLEYASSLMCNTRVNDKCYAQHPHPGYLTVAADYLLHAPILGKSHLELVCCCCCYASSRPYFFDVFLIVTLETSQKLNRRFDFMIAKYLVREAYREANRSCGS
jgi:hypothetical protein